MTINKISALILFTIISNICLAQDSLIKFVPPVLEEIEIIEAPENSFFAPTISYFPNLSTDTTSLKLGEPQLFIYAINELYEKEWISREIKEINNNFPDIKVTRLKKNTVIVIPNKYKDTIVLNNSDERYTGYMYWDGKSKSKVNKGDSFIELSENISQIRGVDKKSSYMAEYNRYIQKISELSKPIFEPSEGVKKNIQNFEIYNAIRETDYVPLRFMNLENVETVKLIFPKGEFLMKCNKEGLIDAIYIYDTEDGKKTLEDSAVFKYRDGLPIERIHRGEFKSRYNYIADTIYEISESVVSKTTLYSKFFIKNEHYLTWENENIKYRKIKHLVYPITTDGKSLCVETDYYTSCYSDLSNDKNYVLTLGYESNPFSKEDIQVSKNRILISKENIHNKNKNEYVVYNIEDGYIKNLEIKLEEQVFNVDFIYTFYK